MNERITYWLRGRARRPIPHPRRRLSTPIFVWWCHVVASKCVDGFPSLPNVCEGAVSSFQRLKVATPPWRIETSSHTLNGDECVWGGGECRRVTDSMLMWSHHTPVTRPNRYGKVTGKIFAPVPVLYWPVPVTRHGSPYPCPSLLPDHTKHHLTSTSATTGMRWISLLGRSKIWRLVLEGPVSRLPKDQDWTRPRPD